MLELSMLLKVIFNMYFFLSQKRIEIFTQNRSSMCKSAKVAKNTAAQEQAKCAKI